MNIEHMEKLCHRSRNFSVVIEGLIKRIQKLRQQPSENKKEIIERIKEMEQLTEEFDKFIIEFESACQLDELSDE